jgi:putative tryptophan/tyrosine transport system substrate-binding protein
MRRRKVIALIGGAVAAWPLAARTQQASRVPRIGFLGATSAAGYASQLEGFRLGLRELGYREGENIAVEFRWAQGRYERLPDLAAELVHLKVDAIVTHGTPATLALKKATATIPIIMAVSGDAVGTGLVSSLGKPGGNVTGLSFFAPELSAKRLELLKETIPPLASLATIFNSNNLSAKLDLETLGRTAKSLGVELQPFEVRGPEHFGDVFSTIAARRVDAVSLIHDAVLTANVKLLAELALAHRLPSIGEGPYVKVGGLIGYGPDFPDLFRRSASYVHRILKGAHPGDLPVEQPVKFEFLLNLVTARAIGLGIPPTILAQADEVIE